MQTACSDNENVAYNIWSYEYWYILSLVSSLVVLGTIPPYVVQKGGYAFSQDLSSTIFPWQMAAGSHMERVIL